MTHMDIKQEDVIDKFEIDVKRFGETYREFIEKDATLRLHLLETHCVRELRLAFETSLGPPALS